MNRRHSDLLKLTIWLVATLVLGGLFAAPLHNLWLSAALARQEGAPTGPTLAGSLSQALVLAGVVLAVPLAHWLRPASAGANPWGPLPRAGLRRDPRGPLNLACGFLAAASSLLLLGMAFVHAGQLSWVSRLGLDDLAWMLGVALGVALACEWWFRGWLLGELSRTHGGWHAQVVVAMVFTLLAGLVIGGAGVPAPDARMAGIQLIGGWLGWAADARNWLALPAPLLAAALVLGYARVRSGSLWLGVGLHAGWLLAALILGRISQDNAGANAWLGQSTSHGVGSLGLAGAAWLLVRWLTLDYPKGNLRRHGG